MATISGTVIGEDVPHNFEDNVQYIINHSLGVPARWLELRDKDGNILQIPNWKPGPAVNSQVTIAPIGPDPYLNAVVILTGITGFSPISAGGQSIIRN